jgi:2Fe-2S ferredoxin
MKINCPQLNKTIEHNGNKRIFDILLDNNVPIASSCRGNGICHWCKIEIISGSEFLNKKSKYEMNLKENVRLCCQIKSKGDITIKSTYW